jgi:uncharacterized damage-inducible protein DinB
LDDYLHGYRLTLLMKCRGLDPEQLARRSVPPSTLSLLGLVRHLADAERDWRGWVDPDATGERLYGTKDGAFDDVRADADQVEAAFTELARQQTSTDEILNQYPDLGTRVGPDDLAIRNIQVHRIEEYARHCGHADLLRECVDGRVGQ